MNENEMFIYKSIVRDMSEGVMTIGMNGKITYLNAAAMSILSLDESAIGCTFASLFLDYVENDAFNQAVLDAVYENSISHNVVVNYFNGESEKHLFMNTSYLRNEDTKIGVTAILNDITELVELQDAVKAMEKIKALNVQLEKRNEFIKKTFGRYLSDEIVKSILDTEGGLTIGGKKQNVTIMFTDIRGFTAVSEKMEPHDLITMLNAYLEKMIKVIMRHNGTILEFIGDAIVVVFGAPLESQTSDRDAVTCAIEMQNEMEAVNAYNASQGFPNIEMGIGIHTGDVVLGNIGSSEKTKYDIIGRNVNLASRIETFTVGGQAFISPVVRANLPGIVTGKEVEIVPKGVKEPITIYELLAYGDYKLNSSEQVFVKLNKPFEISFFILEGKYASKVGNKALVLELSEKEAIIETSAPVEKSMNIKFSRNDEEIYAKIMSHDGNRALIHITSGKLAE